MNTLTQEISKPSRLTGWQPKRGAGILAATIVMIGALHFGSLQVVERNAAAGALAQSLEYGLSDEHRIVVEAPRLVSKSAGATRTASATAAQASTIN